jgi:hypothetical protein
MQRRWREPAHLARERARDGITTRTDSCNRNVAMLDNSPARRCQTAKKPIMLAQRMVITAGHRTYNRNAEAKVIARKGKNPDCAEKSLPLALVNTGQDFTCGRSARSRPGRGHFLAGGVGGPDQCPDAQPPRRRWMRVPSSSSVMSCLVAKDRKRLIEGLHAVLAGAGTIAS